MRRITLTLPEIGLIGGTRAAFGIGVGLLISDRLNRDQRQGAAWALLAIGVITSVAIGVGLVARLGAMAQHAGIEKPRELVA
jgi:hypothetical protein